MDGFTDMSSLKPFDNILHNCITAVSILFLNTIRKRDMIRWDKKIVYIMVPFVNLYTRMKELFMIMQWYSE